MTFPVRNITILHEALDPAARPDERDALVQVDYVAGVLRALGANVAVIGVDLDLAALRTQLRTHRPDVVFNLVEALGGANRLIAVVPALLESLGLPFVGAGPLALALTTDKLATKTWLQTVGLPTPTAWQSGDPLVPHQQPTTWIVKPIAEDASVGIDDDAVVTTHRGAELAAIVLARSARFATPCFAEEYIVGREFNLSLLADSDDVRVLPPAEIEFIGYPSDKPAIVGYAAKWDADSFEYINTPRRFDFADVDAPLLAHLSELARECWRRFELRGWARVDFRVDRDGGTWILEVNANPCLAPDAGFHAAATRAGLSGPFVIRTLIEAAVRAAPREHSHHVSHSPRI